MQKKIHIIALMGLICLYTQHLFGQETASTDIVKIEKPKEERLNILIYNRMIWSADGQFRIDQSIVSNIKLNNWLKLELGVRHGERPAKFSSYVGYKVELQTKSLYKGIRLVVRMSDRIIEYPTPIFIETNYMFVAEGRFPISYSFSLLASGGFVWTVHQADAGGALPTTTGNVDRYPTYKLGLRYKLKDKGFLEALTGSYDVFNPYMTSSPFVQMTFDYEIGKRFTFYSYFRHQYDRESGSALNEFLCLGIRMHFWKR